MGARVPGALIVVALSVGVGGCVGSESTVCGAAACPRGKVCFEEQCIDRAQITTCERLDATATCELPGGLPGNCLRGACLPGRCGDGVVDVGDGEICDDGRFNSDVLADHCRLDCTPARCGDGVRDSGEICDGAGCDAGCQWFTGQCGNGVVDAGEVCDDGNHVSGDGCSADCRSDETCGNGYIDSVRDASGAPLEQCDNGPDVLSDDCSPTCQLEYCGNGVVDPGETCDGTPGCGPDCTVPCGDGLQGTGEECDDGNLFNHDGCHSTCRVEEAKWSQYSPVAQPSERSTHIAYDTARGVAVIYGGREGGNDSDETWEFDGNTWVQVTTATVPSARAAVAMAYLPEIGAVVSYGGFVSGTTYYDETWHYDGADWTLQSLGTRPEARHNSRLVYRSGSGDLLLFGGVIESSRRVTDDTWRYDGVQWTAVSPATVPRPRSSQFLGYDADRQVVVMFGGSDNRTGSVVDLDDTWEYDGTDWAQIQPTNHPSARRAGVFVYHVWRRAFVLFGGATEGVPNTIPHDDTWVYDNGAWTDLGVLDNPPSARASHGVWAERFGGILMFGGVVPGTAGPTQYQDTWLFSYGSAYPDEDCANGIDDDGDRKVDADDPDCSP